MGINLTEVSARRLSRAVIVVMGAILFYGAYMYPDAPIRPCSIGIVTTYCGKHGKTHSLADYEGERRWDVVMFIVWPIGMLSIIALSGKKQKNDPQAP
jgi:hypothetical protein